MAYATDIIPLFDSHSHYKTDDAASFSGEDVIAIMNRENISHMVIVGEPASRAQDLYNLSPERFVLSFESFSYFFNCRFGVTS